MRVGGRPGLPPLHVQRHEPEPAATSTSARRSRSAINRNAIAKADLTGPAWPAETLGNHFFVNTQAGYKDNSGDLGTYNPDKAKQLLDAAGWKQGAAAFRTKGGKTLDAALRDPGGRPGHQAGGRADPGDAQGRSASRSTSARCPSDDFFDKYVIPGNFDITPFSWLGTPFPISSAQSIYANPTKDDKGELQIQQNFARVGSQEIDDLMDKAERRRSTRTRRSTCINQADALIWDEVHSMIFYQRPQMTAREQEPRERRLVRLRAARLHEDRLREQPELIGRAEATERRAAGRRGYGTVTSPARPRSTRGPGGSGSASDASRARTTDRRSRRACRRRARRVRCRSVRRKAPARRPAPSRSSTTVGSRPRSAVAAPVRRGPSGPSTVDDLGGVAVREALDERRVACSGVATSAYGRPRSARKPVRVDLDRPVALDDARDLAARRQDLARVLGARVQRVQAADAVVLGRDVAPGPRRTSPRATRRPRATA